MSWQDQGRQYHQWFGNGKAPQEPPHGAGAEKPGLSTPAERISTVIGTLIAHFPRADRTRAALQPKGRTAADLTQAMTVWIAAAGRSHVAFESALPLGTSSTVASRLLAAATATVDAHDRATITAAGGALASAVQAIGLDNLPRFAASAADAADKMPADTSRRVTTVESAAERVFVDPPLTSQWRQGTQVQGDLTLASGTAIATFDSDGARCARHSCDRSI